MCIILNEISSVTATKIFVAPSLTKREQLTVYQNTVDSPEENLMILPVPHPETIKLHTLEYKGFFDDLFNSVTRISTRSSAPLRYANVLSRSAASVLPIYDYGSYKVSIAPTIDDLLRLDTHVFTLPDGIREFFASHYSGEFGYLCCKLKPGKKEYEPVCYSHALHSSGKLFVPTLHYHIHESRIDAADWSQNQFQYQIHESRTETDAADWDHFIYSTQTTPVANLQFTSNETNQVKWAKLPVPFRYTTSSPIRLARVTGHQKNHDLSFEIV